MTLRLRQYVRASRLKLQAAYPRTFSVTYESQFVIGKLQADLLLKSNAHWPLPRLSFGASKNWKINSKFRHQKNFHFLRGHSKTTWIEFYQFLTSKLYFCVRIFNLVPV